MGSSILPIVYIFIVLVIAYITVGFSKVNSIDVFLIACSLIVLVFTMYQSSGMIQEHFSTAAAAAPDLSKLKPIQVEEDITPLKNNLVVYTTAFNKLSYKI